MPANGRVSSHPNPKNFISVSSIIRKDFFFQCKTLGNKESSFHLHHSMEIVFSLLLQERIVFTT